MATGLRLLMVLCLLGAASVSHANYVPLLENLSKPYWIKIRRGTDLKRYAMPSVEQKRGSELCHIPAGELIYLSEPPVKLSNGYYYVNRADIPPGCSFSSGFISVDHVLKTSEPLERERTGKGFSIEVPRNTFLKRGTGQAEGMRLSHEKCTLYGKNTFDIQGPPILINKNHYIVNLRKKIPGCFFTQGLVYVKHVKVNYPQASQDDGAITKSQRIRAFLSVIAYAEGTHSSYNIMFTGRRFNNGYQDHPRRVHCSYRIFYRLCSTAAGRYQFLTGTWDSTRAALGLRDFGPASQDRAALYLIAARGVRNLQYIDTYSEFSRAIRRLNREWASLPGSPYGQPTHSMKVLWKKYREFGGI